MATPAAASPTIGHNSAAMPLVDRLRSDHEELATEVAAALEAARALPAEVASDADVADVTAGVVRLRGAAKRIEDARVREKEPFLQGGRDVDAFFKDFAERVKKGIDVLERRATAYLRAKAERERAEREQREREAREAAARAAEEARRAAEESRSFDAAIAQGQAAVAEHRAAVAAEDASASTAELARTRTDAGTAGLKTDWTFEIEDASKVPLATIRAFIPRAALEQAIRGFVKAGGRELKGVRIFEVDRASFRSR